MSYAGKSVLIAADNREMRQVLLEMLRRAGFGRIDQAIGAAQARSFGANLRYDCVVIDITRTGELSFDTVKAIRAAQGPKTGIVALAGDYTDHASRQAEGAGANGLMAKPFSAATFATVIERVLWPDPKTATAGGVAESAKIEPADSTDDVYI